MLNVKSISKLLGLDVATTFALLARLWSLISGPITLLVIVRFLTPEVQGYVGVLESIVAVRIFVELGLTTVIMQFIAHERGDIIIDKKKGTAGPLKNLENLASILKNAVRWYLGMAIITFLLVWLGGLAFLSRTADPQSEVSFVLPVVIMALHTAFSLLSAPLFGVLEGLGRIAEYFIACLAAAVVGSIVSWVLYMQGFGLLAIPIASMISLIPGGIMLYRWRKVFGDLLLTKIPLGGGISWTKEVLPLQLKTAVTGVLGYFIFYLTIPMVFAMLGAIVAGQLSQTMRLTAVVLGLANSWIITRAAIYGRLISLKSLSELKSLFRHSLISAVGITIIGSIALWLPLWLIDRYGDSILLFLPSAWSPLMEVIVEIPSRLADFGVLTALLCNTILSSFVYALQSLIRAHRKEPFIPNAVIAAITVPLITYVGASYGSLEMVAWGYFIRTIVIETPLTLFIFSKHSVVSLRDIFAVKQNAFQTS